MLDLRCVRHRDSCNMVGNGEFLFADDWDEMEDNPCEYSACRGAPIIFKLLEVSLFLVHYKRLLRESAYLPCSDGDHPKSQVTVPRK